MAKKRTKANGDGTIFVEIRNNRKYYKAQLVIGYKDDGSLNRKSFCGYERDKVVKRMEDYKYKLNIGLISANSDTTLEQYFHTWLFQYKKIEWKPSTFTRYEGIFRNYIQGSPIAKFKLMDLKTTHFQKYINDIVEEKTISTAKSVKKTIVSCMNYAIKEDLVIKNYCSFVTLPKAPPTKKYPVFTLEQQKTILDSLGDSTYDIAIKLSFGTGLRLGELTALKWIDLNLEEGTLNVNKALKQVNVVADDGSRSCQLLMQTPKTESSNRTVPFPSVLIPVLKKHRHEQLKRIMMYRKAYVNEDFVFENGIGQPLEPRRLPRHFANILEKLEIPYVKFHGIRHTYATRLFENNVPPKVVQTLMGHTDIATTLNIYTHVMPEEKSDAAESLNALFG